MARLIFYIPGLIVYIPMAYKLFLGDVSFEYWMLLLIPFFFVVNTVLFLIFMRLVLTAHMVWKEIKEEHSFYGLACVLLFILGPLTYIFFRISV